MREETKSPTPGQATVTLDRNEQGALKQALRDGARDVSTPGQDGLFDHMRQEAEYWKQQGDINGFASLAVENIILEMKNRNTRPSSGWIPVSERLPDDRIYGWREVIIACAGGLVTYADYWCEEQKFWKDKGEYCERHYHDVTHWMPLPPSPTSTGERE